MTSPAGPSNPPPPPGPGRPGGTAGKVRDAFLVALAQNVILAGLIILTAGVPTW